MNCLKKYISGLLILGGISIAVSQELPTSGSQHKAFVEGKNISFGLFIEKENSTLKAVSPESNNFSIDSILHKSHNNYLDEEYSEYNYDYKHNIDYDSTTNVYSFTWYVYNHEDDTWLQQFKQAETYIKDSLTSLIISYDYDTSANEWISAYRYLYTYDEDYNMQASIEYEYDTESGSWQNLYRTETSYIFSTDTTITFISYNWEDTESAWEPYEKTVTNYEGKIEKGREYTWNSSSSAWRINDYYIDIYTDAGRNKRLILYELNGTTEDTVGIYRKYYDDEGKCISAVDSTMNDATELLETDTKTVYEYNENGNMIKEIDSTWYIGMDDFLYSGLSIYTYNESNKILSLHRIEYDEAGDITTEIIHKYGYNKQGDKNHYYLEYLDSDSEQEYFYYYPVEITDIEMADTTTVIITFNDYLENADDVSSNITISPVADTYTSIDVIEAYIPEDEDQLILTFNRKIMNGESFEIVCGQGLFAAYDQNVSFSVSMGNATETAAPESSPAPALIIYPAVASDAVIISSPESIDAFSVYSTNGTLVLYDDSVSDETCTVSVVTLPSGTYYIHTAKGASGIFIKK